jgi:hypothetical protein
MKKSSGTREWYLRFAPFEREVTGERIQDKIAASKRRNGPDRAASESRLSE